jgi:TonB family protein
MIRADTLCREKRSRKLDEIMKAIGLLCVAVCLLGVASGLPIALGQEPSPGAAAAKPAVYAAPGRLIKRVDPVYPSGAKTKYVQGTVVMTATIAADGTVKDIKVTSGNVLFTKAAADAVAQWRFEPYRVEGVATDVSRTIEVNFALASGVPQISGDVVEPNSMAQGPGAVGRVPLPPPPAGVLRISGRVMATMLDKKVDPVYPPDSIAVDAQGAVVLLATIKKSGEVSDVQVLSGPQRFRDAAMDAVKQWHYQPYVIEGQAVDVQTTIKLDFAPPAH